MAHPLDDDLEPIYEAIFDGRVKVVGWGAVGPFPYFEMQSPFPIDYLVDADPRQWNSSICGIPIWSPDVLRDEEADNVVVVVFPIYNDAAVRQILTQLETYGRFRAIPPFRIEKDGALVRSMVERCLLKPGIDPAALPAVLRRARASFMDMPDKEAIPELVRSIRDRFSGGRPAVPRRARLIIGSLQPGGAERQICYLAVGLKQRGWDVAMLAFAPTQPGAEHYAQTLERAGIPLDVLPSARDFFSELQADAELFDTFRAASPVLMRFPSYLIHWTLAAYRRLAADRPELVVTYLDVVNMSAGLAAVLAGVGHVLLSGRNVHPGNFLNHYAQAIHSMKECYGWMSNFPEVRLSANSTAGARSYADWLGLPYERVTTVPNGVPTDTVTLPPAASIDTVRRELGVADGTPLIVGVFRLAEEKQPLLFVEVIRRLHNAGAMFKAALVGVGPMADAVREAVEHAGLSERLLLLGVREDVRVVIAASDLVLHVALAEGHPNILLEAQLLGKPVVTTEAEGAKEVLAPVHRDYICRNGDGDELAARARAILNDLAAAKRRSAEATAWVADAFSMDRLIDNTLVSAGLPRTACETGMSERIGARIVALDGIELERGFAWRAPLPDWIPSGDREEDGRASGLRLFEDGAELMPGHAPHDAIREQGGGRYSHWHRSLWFSTSDHSDPRGNGRRYQILVPAPDADLLHGMESEVQALRTTDATDLDRHRVLRRFARAIYPSYTLSDHSRLIDRDTAFFDAMDRFLPTGDVVHDRRFGLAQFARIAASVPGDIAEAGCYNGAGAFAIARTLESLGIRRTIHLFDSFAGLSQVEAVDGDVWKQHDLACDLATTRANLAAFDFVEYWPGWIPERFAEVAERTFALVHIDVDLHQPTLQSLEFFYPRVAPGGLIVLDDYGFTTCPGVTEAVDMFFADKPEAVMNLASGGALVIKSGNLA